MIFSTGNFKRNKWESFVQDYFVKSGLDHYLLLHYMRQNTVQGIRVTCS